jgi:hypothetical protein
MEGATLTMMGNLSVGLLIVLECLACTIGELLKYRITKLHYLTLFADMAKKTPTFSSL